MSKYATVPGDTIFIVARKRYGTEDEAHLIRAANPGVLEPMLAGTELVIPVKRRAPTQAPDSVPTDSEDETVLTILEDRFRFWTDIKIKRSVDAFDTVEFTTPFEPSNKQMRASLKPFGYQPMTVSVGGDLLFTGTVMSPVPKLSAKSSVVSVEGYALPAVLGDCTPPLVKDKPWAYRDMGVKEIAEDLAAPFGLKVVLDGDQGPIFTDEVSVPAGKKVGAFLIKLLKQRNLVMSNTPEGDVLFQQSDPTGRPVAKFVQGEPPLLSVTPVFRPQEYYSHISGQGPQFYGIGGDVFTVRNPHVVGLVRPLTFTPSDAESADIKQAVDSKMGRMFANAVAYKIKTNSWRDSKGRLWEPNTSVTLLAPRAMVYKEYEFIVKSVELDQTGAAKTATLVLMMPGGFQGKIPESLPWDD